MIKIRTRDAGEIEVDPDTILVFPVGLPGFERNQRYKLFHDAALSEEEASPVGGGARVYWLQSLEEPEVVFSVVDPGQVGIGYQVSLSEAEMELLQLQPDAPEDLAVLMILSRVADGAVDLPHPSRSLVHLVGPKVRPHVLGPLFINVKSRRGIQKVLSNTRFTLTVEELPA